MAQRRHHYEQAFEHYLRSRRMPYVAVDEAKKALLPSGMKLSCLKSFDFMIYGSKTNLLIEVKGRKVRQGRSGSSGRLESWVTQEDVDSLLAWQGLFGDGFEAALVFIYWFDSMPQTSLFEEMFVFKDRWYAMRALQVDPYSQAMRVRSPKWGTVDLSRADFERLSQRLEDLTGLSCESIEQWSLHNSASPVASAP